MKRAAFYGPPGSGKTTLAHSMEHYYGGEVIPFAEALREEVAENYPIPLEDLSRIPEKYKHRATLQKVGAERRAEDPDYWVQRWLEKVHKHIGWGTRTLWVDDMRYDNELMVAQELHFVIIECLPNPDGDAIQDNEKGHESEVDWKLWTPDIKMEWRPRATIRAAELVLMLNVGVGHGD